MDKVILVKLTSRERPEKLIDCIKKALSLAVNPTAIKWLISLDVDDSKCNNLEFTNTLNSLLRNPTIVFGASHGKIHAINRDVETFSKLEKWDILVNLSDDQLCEVMGWDSVIRESMPNDLDWSLWFWDGLQQSINTMEIVGFNYYGRFGSIYNPSYKSFYCDEESTLVAQKLKRQIRDKRCLFKHAHPAGDNTIKNDELYAKNQVYWHHDKMNFNNRMQLNFGV